MCHDTEWGGTLCVMSNMRLRWAWMAIVLKAINTALFHSLDKYSAAKQQLRPCRKSLVRARVRKRPFSPLSCYPPVKGGATNGLRSQLIGPNILVLIYYIRLSLAGLYDKIITQNFLATWFPFITRILKRMRLLLPHQGTISITWLTRNKETSTGNISRKKNCLKMEKFSFYFSAF